MSRGPVLTVCLAWLVVLAVGTTAAVGQTGPVPETLTGDIILTHATLHGRTTGSAEAMGALYVTSDVPGSGSGEGPVEGRLEISASGVVVNRSYVREREVGVNPLNPDETLVAVVMERRSDEDTYGHAEVALSYAAREVDLLLRPDGGPVGFETSAGDDVAEWTAAPAPDGAWRAGMATENTDSRGDPSLTDAFNLTEGDPVLSTASSLQWTGQGDMVLHVWGANVTVAPVDGEPRTYRSGRWWTDRVGEEVHPHGVTSEHHAQLLRIHLSNATFAWRHDQGPAYQTAETFDLETDGAVTYEASRGFLESAEFEYAVEQASFRIDGVVRQTLGPRPDADELGTRVLAEDATVSLPPSGRAAEAADGSSTSDASGGPSSGPAVPGAAASMWPLILAGVVLALSAAAGTWTVRRREDPDLPRLGPLEKAEIALMNRDTRKARRLARKVLDKNDADLDAWLIYGASLVKERAYDRAVRELEPVAERLGDEAGLAFVLTLAHAHRGDDAGVLRWGRLAAKTPEIRRELLDDPAMAPYLDRAVFRRALGGDAGVAYA